MQKDSIPVNFDPPHASMKIGDKFTIEGIKIVGPGRFITNCKPGEETVMVHSKEPSVFKLRGVDRLNDGEKP